MKPRHLLTLLGLVAAALVLTGCVVSSLAPFYLKGDLVFEAALVGTWVDQPSTDAPANPQPLSPRFKFEKAADGGYLLTETIPGMPQPVAGNNVLSAHLFGLGGRLFLDMTAAPTTPPSDSAYKVRVHALLQVVDIQPVLRVKLFQYTWLAPYLQSHPEALRHLWVAEAEQGNRCVLTAETAELQAFLLKHVETAEAWGPEAKLVRLEKGDATPGK